MPNLSLRSAISRALVRKDARNLSPVYGGSWTTVFDNTTGAWQQNVTVNQETAASYWAFFACATLISGDVAKLALRVMQKQDSGIWKETLNRPVLRRPNHYQTRYEFVWSWVMSKILNGNTYILKQRDERGFIVALYVLDPTRVTALVAIDGSVFYQLRMDNLSGLEKSEVTVPASEIIHDKWSTIYHPLVGVGPLYASGTAAMQGAAIQGNSTKFFENMSRPSGLLTAPAAISPETATRLKTDWQDNYTAGNFGKVAVLGDGLKYEAMTITATDAQLIEQLKMTAEMICATLHVPGYKIGVGQMPTVNNTASLNQQYYDTCLQTVIEPMELLLDIGLELPAEGFQVWFDVNGLIRMDPETRYRSYSEGIKGGWMAPNEARIAEDLEPVEGGNTPFLQQQNWSLEQLNRRDIIADSKPVAPPPAEPDSTDKALHFLFRKAPETLHAV